MGLGPILARCVISLLCAIVFGTGGLLLYYTGTCWWGVQDCAAYSPVKISLAYAFCWPLFLVHRICFGPSEFIPNFDPAIGKGGWLAMWAYYYLVLYVLGRFFKSVRRAQVACGPSS